MSLLMERCPFPKQMTLPFMVQGGPPYRGPGISREREKEKERECLLAPSVRVVSSVS
jgi:hypothetical protein